MIIKYKNKNLYINQFKLKCCIGKAGIKKKKLEGDKGTPLGKFKLGNLYFRADKTKNIKTNLTAISIKKNMGWCNDTRSTKYNKLINIRRDIKLSYEKLFRKDFKYDLMIPIYYNYFKVKKNYGSAIFIHLTKSYKPTVGCLALSKKDFLIMIKLINKNSKIVIEN